MVLDCVNGLHRWMRRFFMLALRIEDNIPLPGRGANGGLPIVALRYPTFESFFYSVDEFSVVNVKL